MGLDVIVMKGGETLKSVACNWLRDNEHKSVINTILGLASSRAQGAVAARALLELLACGKPMGTVYDGDDGDDDTPYIVYGPETRLRLIPLIEALYTCPDSYLEISY